MRVVRWMVVAAVVGSTIASATPARADGGAYLSFDETYYVRGDQAHGESYVYIPEKQLDILDRGPFYAYLVPPNQALEEGRALPSGTIRLGAFAVDVAKNGETELTVSFTVPDVPSGSYSIQLCNDPCTVAGFREPQTGEITIAATTVEANLMRERDRLNAALYGLKRRIRRDDREREALQQTLDTAVDTRDGYALRIAELEAHTTSTAADPTTTNVSSSGRPLVDAWALVTLGAAALVVVLSVGLALAFSRRRPSGLAIPD
jgi:hypothetical protein